MNWWPISLNDLYCLRVGASFWCTCITNPFQNLLIFANFHLEAGHMRIPNTHNYSGVCNLHGDCWEGLASGPSMKARWGVDPVDLPKNHEAWAIEAKLLSLGLINIISTYSPEKIIVGGGVLSQEHLLSMIRSNIAILWNNFTPLGDLSNLITKPVLGKDSGIIGALSLVC